MYIKDMTGYMVISLPIFLIIRYLYIKIKHKKTTVIKEVVLATFVLYIVGLASQTVIPKWYMGFIYEEGFYFDFLISNNVSQINLVPFHTISQYLFELNPNLDAGDSGGISILNIAANMFLFTPLGFFIPLIWSKWDSFKKMFLVGLVITCLVEVLQFFIGRSTDIDDVILNVFGIIIGYGIYLFFKKFCVKPHIK